MYDAMTVRAKGHQIGNGVDNSRTARFRDLLSMVNFNEPFRTRSVKSAEIKTTNKADRSMMFEAS